MGHISKQTAFVTICGRGLLWVTINFRPSWDKLAVMQYNQGLWEREVMSKIAQLPWVRLPNILVYWLIIGLVAFAMYVAVRNAEIGSLSTRSGIIVFNSPNKMQWKKPQVIAAVLSEKISSDNLKERIKKYGMVDSSKITISNKMEVHLSGEPAFDIRPITPLVQAITKDQITEWKWQVTPLQRGKQILFLTASIYIVDKATDIPRVVESLEREITVEVTIPELLAGLWNDYWQWILATVVFPLVIYGWRQGLKRWKSRHRFDFDG